MTTLLKKALEKVKRLPTRAQDGAAELIMEYVSHSQRDVRLSDEQLAEVRRRLADKKRKTITLKQLDTRLRRLGIWKS